MSQASISLSDERLSLCGVVDFSTVARLRKQGDVLIQQMPHPIVDLAQADCPDSSACVLILAWLRCAHSLGKSLQLVNVPHHLLAVAEVYGIKEFISENPCGLH